MATTVQRLTEHVAHVRLTAEAENVHQARVATRRLRSDLGTFDVLFEPGSLGDLRSELAWLGEVLGKVRDADVLGARLAAELQSQHPDEPTSTQVLDRISRERGRAQLQLLAVLDDDRCAILLQALEELAADPTLTEVAAAPADAYLPLIASRPWHRLQKTVAQLDRNPTDDQLHSVRIAAKRTRYAAESVVSVVGKPAERFAEAVADLQTALGDYNDAVISAAWLRGAAQDMDALTAFVAGALSQRQRSIAGNARNRLPAAWKKLNRKKMHAWLGDA